MTTGTRSQAAAAGAVGEPTPASPRKNGGRKSIPFDPKLHCGFKVWGTRPGIKLRPGEKPRRKGQPCRMYHGARTTHPGIGHCWLHGGRSVTHRAHAAKEQLRNELRELAMPDQAQAIEKLRDMVRVASWREMAARLAVQKRTTMAGPDHLGDDRPDVAWQMHAAEVKRLAEIAKMAVDAGLDSRMVELAEREAELLHRALLAGLEAGGVTSAKAREAAFEAVRGVIDQVAPAVPVGAELS